MNVDLIEIAALSLGPNDVLAVKICSDEISMEEVSSLKERLQTMFPNNRIMMTIIPTNSSLELSVIKPTQEIK